ncbi:MAG: C-terminal binding protein [Oscillospiraceae bacterium]|nr:C-terminal binding protein [Oscillospiraceae bacterium]
MAKVVYYNIDGGLDYERALLAKWGVADLELAELRETCGDVPNTASIADADGLVVEYQKVTQEVMDALPRLKIVALQSIGYNNVDPAAATAHGICLTNVPGFCAEEVALHCVGLAIDLVRKITFLDRAVRAGAWNPLLGYKTYRVTGATFGLVYFGAIPKTMVPMLQGLGLKILVYAPTKTAEYLAEFGCEKAETLDELLERADFVSLHTPLSPQTFHLIGAAQLKRMKPSAFLINTARGSVVDESALVDALRDGTIKGAGIDVIEDETNERSELFTLENTVITPHAAFMSEDSFYDAREKALAQLVLRLSKGERPEFLVNKDVKF